MRVIFRTRLPRLEALSGFAIVLLIAGALNVSTCAVHRAGAHREDGLGLSVSGEKRALTVTWRIPAGSSPAVLVVRDGSRQRAIPLAPEQVRRGELKYRRNSADVSFRLTMGGRYPQAEMVRYIAAN